MNQLGYSLIITNESGDSVDLYDDLELAVTSTGGFGLDAEISTTESSTGDGSVFSKARLPERTLTFSVQYYDIKDTEAAKLRVHRVCAFRDRLKIRYISNHKDCYIYGYCEKCETPENTFPMVTNITIICPDPYWNSSANDGISVPFENGQCEIDYDGDAPAGVQIILTPITSIVKMTFSINDESLTSDNLLMATGPGWVDAIQSYEPGGIVKIDTRERNKIVSYNGVDRFVTTKVGEPYPMLYPGHNVLKIEADGEFTAECIYSVKSGGF